MDRALFEAVRDVPGKVIRGDIRLVGRRQTQPALVAENIVIENSSGVRLRLNINYNPEVGSKTFNVTVAGVGRFAAWMLTGPLIIPQDAATSTRYRLSAVRTATCLTA